MANTTILHLVDGANNAFTVLVEGSANGAYTPHHVIELSGNVVSNTNPLPTFNPNANNQATFVKATNTQIISGGTAQVLYLSNTIVNGYRVQNPSTATESLFVDDTGAYASSTSGSSIELQAGDIYYSTMVPTTNVTIMAATTGHSFNSQRW